MNYANPPYPQNPPYPGYPPQNYARPKKKNELWFVLAGVCLILNALLLEVIRVLQYIYFDVPLSYLFVFSDWKSILILTEKLVLIALGVCCIVFRKNHAVFAVLYGFLSLTELIYLIDICNASYVFDIFTYCAYLLTAFIWVSIMALAFLNLHEAGHGVGVFIVSVILTMMLYGGWLSEDLQNFADYFTNQEMPPAWILTLVLQTVIFVVSLILLATAIFIPEEILSARNFSEGYCGMTKHVLLLLFTFGIWQYIWIYRTTKLLNSCPFAPKRNPVTKVLLCMCVPFYLIYWTYQSARSIDAFARQNGISSDITSGATVLALFVGFVPPILMQSKINQICERSNRIQQYVGAQTNSVPVQPFASSGNVPPAPDSTDISNAARPFSGTNG